MFEQLPKAIQKQVLNCLETDNFVLAKQLYDAWRAEDNESTTVVPSVSTSPNDTSK